MQEDIDKIEKMREYKRLWYHKNKEQNKEKFDKTIKQQMEYNNVKYKTDQEYREKIKKRNREYNQKNPNLKRNRALKYNYGITLEDYNYLFEKQDGKCAICNKLPVPGSSKNKNLYLDHDHNTGKVRGLLCNMCNLGLGKFNDDLILLERASAYLRDNL